MPRKKSEKTVIPEVLEPETVKVSGKSKLAKAKKKINVVKVSTTIEAEIDLEAGAIAVLGWLFGGK